MNHLIHLLVGGWITRIKIKFIIEKQVGETGSGQVYKLDVNQDGKPDGRLHEETAERREPNW